LSPTPPPTPLQLAGRLLLAAALFVAGTAHLVNTSEFYAQVPDWLPVDEELVVVASGFVELGLAAALVVLRRHLVVVGWVVAAFFVAVFPGNISQYVTGTDAFGLDTDTKRLVRLFFQPVLVIWALWCTGAWSAWRARRR
jgi:uncharacterized membrane protein